MKKLNLTLALFFSFLALLEIAYSIYTTFIFYFTVDFEVLIQTLIFLPALLLTIVAFITLLVNLLSCVSVLQDVICCLHSWPLVLIFIIFAVLQTGGGLYYLTLFNSSNLDIPKEIKRSLEVDLSTNNGTLIYRVQEIVKCCGLSNPLDWNSTTFPDSCCSFTTGNATCNVNSTNIYNVGCFPKQVDYIYNVNNYLSYIQIGNGVLQMIAAMTSCFVMRAGGK